MKSRTGGQQDTRESTAEKKIETKNEKRREREKTKKIETKNEKRREREKTKKIETKTNSLLSYYQPTNNDD